MVRIFLKEPIFKIKKNFIQIFSEQLATKIIYKKATGKKLNLKEPKNFNEKIQWLKFNWQHPLLVKCADKYEVRSYVKEKGLENLLNELFGVYNTTRDIDWDILPQKFVLKTTNGSHTNIIVKDKNQIDKVEVVRQLDKWLKKDFGKSNIEPHYSQIKPKIICEKFIETTDSHFPDDYKFYCFNGEPLYCQFMTNRHTDLSKGMMAIYDMQWNKIDVIKDKAIDINVAKPNKFEDMINYARHLSKDFPFVRVDLYNEGETIIFGELTFTPAAGRWLSVTDSMLDEMGDKLKLPKEKFINYKKKEV